MNYPVFEELKKICIHHPHNNQLNTSWTVILLSTCELIRHSHPEYRCCTTCTEPRFLRSLPPHLQASGTLQLCGITTPSNQINNQEQDQQTIEHKRVLTTLLPKGSAAVAAAVKYK